MDWQLTRQLNFDGRTVRWDAVGDGEPVVMAHGTPWSSYNLRHLINELSATNRVYFFDLLGYGQSDMSDGDVSLGVQNVLLDRLIDYWELEAPVAIGHDFGGATVLRTHLLNNRRFQKLVLIDPVAVSPWGSPFFRHVHEHEAAFAGVPDYIHEAIVRAYVQTAAHLPLPEETLDGIVEPWVTVAGKAAFYRQIAQADSRFTDEVQSRYNGIAIPTLILWGEEDQWIPVDRGEELQKLIPDSQLVRIPDSGHLVIEEKPLELAHEIAAFLKTES